MFKGLTRGRRNARATAQSSAGRVGGVKALREMPSFGRRMRPAFLPDTPEEQVRDYTGPRVDEVGKG